MAINYDITLPLESTPLLIVREGTLNQDTSLKLVGHTAPGYGKAHAENFAKLLTNFAGTTEPANKKKGQLWYDGSSMKFWNGSTWVGLYASSTTGLNIGVTQGGTGLSAIGSPGQFLGVKNDGTGLGYQNWWSVVPGTGLNLGSSGSKFANEIHANFFKGVADSATTSGLANFANAATTANHWETPRTIQLSGDVTGSIAIDGTTNVNLVATVATAITNQFLLKTGGTMTGAITLAGDAVLPTQPTTLQQVTSLIATANDTGEHVGKVETWFATYAPPGTLVLDGSVVNRSDFPLLWSFVQAHNLVVTDAIWLGGTFSKFSSGNGTTNFRLPDLRGEFIRGWDKGRGIDSGRAIGTWQGGTIIVGEDAANTVNIANVASNPGKWGMDPASTQPIPTDLVGMATAASSSWDVDAAIASHGGIARPRNVALLMTVRYR